MPEATQNSSVADHRSEQGSSVVFLSVLALRELSLFLRFVFPGHRRNDRKRLTIQGHGAYR